MHSPRPEGGALTRRFPHRSFSESRASADRGQLPNRRCGTLRGRSASVVTWCAAVELVDVDLTRSRRSPADSVVLGSSVDEALVVERSLTAVVRHCRNDELDRAVVHAGADSYDVDDMRRKARPFSPLISRCAFAMSPVARGSLQPVPSSARSCPQTLRRAEARRSSNTQASRRCATRNVV
jgi:hypothetical protein